MSGFRQPETPRGKLVLWEQRLDDAIPVDHSVRQVDHLLWSEAFHDMFREWERRFMLALPRDTASYSITSSVHNGSLAR